MNPAGAGRVADEPPIHVATVEVELPSSLLTALPTDTRDRRVTRLVVVEYREVLQIASSGKSLQILSVADAITGVLFDSDKSIHGAACISQVVDRLREHYLDQKALRVVDVTVDPHAPYATKKRLSGEKLRAQSIGPRHLTERLLPDWVAGTRTFILPREGGPAEDNKKKKEDPKCVLFFAVSERLATPPKNRPKAVVLGVNFGQGETIVGANAVRKKMFDKKDNVVKNTSITYGDLWEKLLKWLFDQADPYEEEGEVVELPAALRVSFIDGSRLATYEIQTGDTFVRQKTVVRNAALAKLVLARQKSYAKNVLGDPDPKYPPPQDLSKLTEAPFKIKNSPNNTLYALANQLAKMMGNKFGGTIKGENILTQVSKCVRVLIWMHWELIRAPGDTLTNEKDGGFAHFDLVSAGPGLFYLSELLELIVPKMEPLAAREGDKARPSLARLQNHIGMVVEEGLRLLLEAYLTKHKFNSSTVKTLSGAIILRAKEALRPKFAKEEVRQEEVKHCVLFSTHQWNMKGDVVGATGTLLAAELRNVFKEKVPMPQGDGGASAKALRAENFARWFRLHPVFGEKNTLVNSRGRYSNLGVRGGVGDDVSRPIYRQYVTVPEENMYSKQTNLPKNKTKRDDYKKRDEEFGLRLVSARYSPYLTLCHMHCKPFPNTTTAGAPSGRLYTNLEFDDKTFPAEMRLLAEETTGEITAETTGEDTDTAVRWARDFFQDNYAIDAVSLTKMYEPFCSKETFGTRDLLIDTHAANKDSAVDIFDSGFIPKTGKNGQQQTTVQVNDMPPLWVFNISIAEKVEKFVDYEKGSASKAFLSMFVPKIE